MLKFHNLYGDDPARLSSILSVWLVPGASTGWVEGLAGLNSTPLSSAYCEGLSPVLSVSFVKPEWHLKQSWYSRVTRLAGTRSVSTPLRSVYVGAAPLAPFSTETPETPARRPEASH